MLEFRARRAPSAGWEGLPGVKDWILQVPATAGMRGILLGAGLGAGATGARVLLAIDRPYAEG